MACVGITARNAEQKQLIEAIFDKTKPIILVTGAAGTGKSLITIAAALELCIKNKRYDGIVFSRDLVQCGEAIGFLPGDLNDKMDPFMICLEDSLDVISASGAIPIVSKMNNDWAKEWIETSAITFMRGRSINKKIIIIDEAQNLDMNTIKTLLTRVGEDSKIILLGDRMQIDKRGQTKGACDFAKAIDKLQDEDFVQTVHLVKSERSPFCARVDELLSE